MKETTDMALGELFICCCELSQERKMRNDEFATNNLSFRES